MSKGSPVATVVPSVYLGVMSVAEYARVRVLDGVIAAEEAAICKRHPDDDYYSDRVSERFEWIDRYDEEARALPIETLGQISRALGGICLRMSSEWPIDESRSMLRGAWLAGRDVEVPSRLAMALKHTAHVAAREATAAQVQHSKSELWNAMTVRDHADAVRVFEMMLAVACAIGSAGVQRRPKILFKWLEG